MGRILRRDAAKRDLAMQWAWYAEQGGGELADRFLGAAEMTLRKLATQPEMGVEFGCSAGELRGIRRFPVASPFEKMLLFYFPLESGADLVRVIHGSRDVPALIASGFLDG